MVAKGCKEAIMWLYHTKFWSSLLHAARPNWVSEQLGDSREPKRRSMVWVAFGFLRLMFELYLVASIIWRSSSVSVIWWGGRDWWGGILLILALAFVPYLFFGHYVFHHLARFSLKLAWWRLMGVKYDDYDRQLRGLAMNIHMHKSGDRTPHDQREAFTHAHIIARALGANVRKDLGEYVTAARELGI